MNCLLHYTPASLYVRTRYSVPGFETPNIVVDDIHRSSFLVFIFRSETNARI